MITQKTTATGKGRSRLRGFVKFMSNKGRKHEF